MLCNANQSLGSIDFKTLYLMNIKFKVVVFEPNPPTIPNIPFQNGVGLVSVSFAIFNFICCKVIDIPIFYIANIQLIMATFFFHPSTFSYNQFSCSLFNNLDDIQGMIMLCSIA
jgi:hypothetical protein